MAPGTLQSQGNPWLRQGPGPLQITPSVPVRSESGDSLCSEQRQAGVRLLVGPDDMLEHQLPEIMVVFLAPKTFVKNLKGVPHPGPIGQHDGGSLHKQPGGTEVAPSEQAGKTSPPVDTTTSIR